MKKTLTREAKMATRMLKGKVVLRVWRHRKKEVGILFKDGTRLFLNHKANDLELSIT